MNKADAARMERLRARLRKLKAQARKQEKEAALAADAKLGALVRVQHPELAKLLQASLQD